MEQERTKNSVRNFLFGFFNRLVIILMPFITRTIIIYKLGSEYLGLSSLFTSVLSMLSFTELGIGAAIGFCLYKPMAEGKNEEVGALLNLLKNMYRLVGTIILAAGLILLPFLDKLISGDRPADMNIYILYLIYLSQSVLSYFLFSFKNSLLNVGQRNDIMYKVNTSVELVRYILQIIVLLFFADYYIYALLLPIGQIIANLFINHYTNKSFPDIKIKGSVDKETKKVILSKVLFLSGHTITSKISTSIGSVIISASLGLVAVAIYGNYTYISGAILSFIVIGYSAVKSSVGNVIYKDGGRKNVELYKPLSFSAWSISSVLYTCMFCLYQPFMIMWVGEENLLGFWAMLFCTANAFVNSQRQFFSSIYIGISGLWNKTLSRQILELSANLLLSFLLVGRYGITGVVFAAFISHTAIGLVYDYFIVYKEILNIPLRTHLFLIIGRYSSTIILAGAAYFVTTLIPLDGILGFIVKGIVAATISGVPILLVKIRSDEMRFIINHIKPLLKRNKKA